MCEHAGGGFFEGEQRYLHVGVIVPECLCHGVGSRRCGGGVCVGDAERVSGELWDIGERVSDEHSSGKAAGPRFGVDGEADGFAEAPSGGDEFVTSDEGGNPDSGSDRAGCARDDVEEEACCALSGLEKVDVRVGVVGNDGVALFEHAACWNPVEIERDNDGNIGSENATGFRQKVAFGIELCFRGHGAVHAEVDGVNGRRFSDSLEELGGDALPR